VVPYADSYFNWAVPGYEGHPMNWITWDDASRFCTWAGGRLPSEAEWEYAARGGGQRTTYPWDNEPATCEYAVMDDGEVGCGSGETSPVCSKIAGNTTQGLCDMAGNVMEWVQDKIHADYAGAPSDGSRLPGPPLQLGAASLPRLHGREARRG
jgi:formylglycine-generating enzyme required for sulfatase activity